MGINVNIVAEERKIIKALSEYERKIRLILNPNLTEGSKKKKGTSSEGITSPSLFLKRKGTINFYIYYPFLFWEEFPQVPLGKVEALAVSWREFLNFILDMDEVFDRQSSVDPKLILRGTLFLKESLRLLYSIFPQSSPFWRYFEKYFKEFAQSVLLEHSKHFGVITPYSTEEMQSIAKGKAAMSKCVTAALSVLSKNEEKIEALSISQDYFNIAFQLYDDLKDWKEDYDNQRYSYLLTRVIQKYNADKKHKRSNLPNSEIIGRCVYFSGSAENQLREAENFLDKAKIPVEGFKCCHWFRIIADFKKSCEQLRVDLKEIKNRILSKHGAHKKRNSGNNKTEKLLSSVNFAIEFLVSNQSLKGIWEDFIMLDGDLATNLVTGYVGLALKDTGCDLSILLTAAEWLMKEQSPTGGWGLHKGLPTDAYSTAYCILFLLNFPHIPEEQLCKPIRVLLAHQDGKDGGFKKYLPIKELRNFLEVKESSQLKGWCSSHLCVTGVVAQALLKFGFKANSCEVRKALAYIRSRQDTRGFWDSYFFHGRIYSTFLAIKVLKATGDSQDRDRLKRASSWLRSIQLHDGGWNNGFSGESKPFHTALAVQSLMEVDNTVSEMTVRKGINWLLNKQFSDGSWKAYPTLRFPFPRQLKPWKQEVWKEDNLRPLGSVHRDPKRLFTTATILASLSEIYRS